MRQSLLCLCAFALAEFGLVAAVGRGLRSSAQGQAGFLAEVEEQEEQEEEAPDVRSSDPDTAGNEGVALQQFLQPAQLPVAVNGELLPGTALTQMSGDGDGKDKKAAGDGDGEGAGSPAPAPASEGAKDDKGSGSKGGADDKSGDGSDDSDGNTEAEPLLSIPSFGESSEKDAKTEASKKGDKKDDKKDDKKGDKKDDKQDDKKDDKKVPKEDAVEAPAETKPAEEAPAKKAEPPAKKAAPAAPLPEAAKVKRSQWPPKEEYRTCSPPCIKNRGVCNDNMCFCRSPYTGTTCQHKIQTLSRVSTPLAMAAYVVFFFFGILMARLVNWIYFTVKGGGTWGNLYVKKEVWHPPEIQAKKGGGGQKASSSAKKGAVDALGGSGD